MVGRRGVGGGNIGAALGKAGIPVAIGLGGGTAVVEEEVALKPVIANETLGGLDEETLVLSVVSFDDQKEVEE